MFRRRSDLDQVIGHWSKQDPITPRMMCQNMAIFGKTGSGKTSGAGDYLFRCLIRHRNTGGLFIASKPEDRRYVERVFKEERTLDDLLIFEPGGQYQYNIMEDAVKRGADTRMLTQMLMVFGEPSNARTAQAAQ